MNTQIKGIENGTFNVTKKEDISELSYLMNMPLAKQADDNNIYHMERVLNGRKRKERTHICLKVNGEFVKII